VPDAGRKKDGEKDNEIKRMREKRGERERERDSLLQLSPSSD